MGDDGEYQEAECTKSGARAVFVVVDMCCCCASVLQQISRVLCIEHCSSLYAFKRGTSYQVCVELLPLSRWISLLSHNNLGNKAVFLY